MKKAENLIVACARTIYRNARFRPKVQVFEKGRRTSIEVDVSPYNPGLLIGEGGSMKFALQLLIAYGYDLDDRDVSIHFASTKTKEIDRSDPTKPDPKKIEKIARAAADLLGGCVEVEASESAAMAMFELPKGLARNVKPPLNKIIRACGKAVGFAALPYVKTLK